MRRTILLALFVTIAAHAQTPLREGVITAGQSDERWSSRIAIENPSDVAAFVTIGGTRITVDAHDTQYAAASGAFSSTQPVHVYRIDENTTSGAQVVTEATTIPARRRAVQFFPGQGNPTPHTVTLTPSKDNTLYETTDGSASNGAGVHLFVGDTAGGSRRRALIAFDIASQIPPGATVTSVSLTMQVTRTISGGTTDALHPLTKDWGEAGSKALDSRDGGGAAAQNGDATWIHTFRPDQRWTTAGGDFGSPDASALVSSIGVKWDSNAALVARVQGWVTQPSTNFGWIIIGNEGAIATTKEFASREAEPASARPALTVEFTTR